METKQKSGMFRKRRISFAQVSSVALLDNTLSSKAKGLYSVIQYFINIPEFTLYKNTLRKHMAEGDKAFDNMWKELKDKGYLIQYRLQGEKGHYYYEYELLDEPNLDLAIEIHSSQNRKKSEEKDSNHKNRFNAKAKENQHFNHTPKMEVMDNEHYGEVGVYNNNNLNNNNLNNINKTTTIEKSENIDIKKIESKKSSSSKIKINLDLKNITKTNIKKLKLNQEQIDLLEEYVLNSACDDIDGFSYFIAKSIKNGEITRDSLKSKSHKINKQVSSNKVTTFEETREKQLEDYNNAIEDDFNNLTL